jgi:hypothetical protein
LLQTGTREEALVFNFYIFSDRWSSVVGSPIALETITYTARPDNSITVDLGPIDLTNSSIPVRPQYACTLGKNYFVSAPVTGRYCWKDPWT